MIFSRFCSEIGRISAEYLVFSKKHRHSKIAVSDVGFCADMTFMLYQLFIFCYAQAAIMHGLFFRRHMHEHRAKVIQIDSLFRQGSSHRHAVVVNCDDARGILRLRKPRNGRACQHQIGRAIRMQYAGILHAAKHFGAHMIAAYIGADQHKLLIQQHA